MFDFEDLEDSLPYEGNPLEDETHASARAEPRKQDDEGQPAAQANARQLVPPAVLAQAPVDDGFGELRTAAGANRLRYTADEEREVRLRSAEALLAAVGDPYAVLGLGPDASSGEVRRAYHKLALLHHPDKAGDSEAFKALNEAYRTLTAAKDEHGGWRDLDGQAVGPWQAHTEKVVCMHFDVFGGPPWESRRLYTGSWSEGAVRCWELSQGEPGKTAAPPRLIGQIEVGGFINDVAPLSPSGLLTAQSAGMKPQPGESLRAWDLDLTPFKPVKRRKGKAALANGAVAGGAPADGSVSQRRSAGGSELALQADGSELVVKDQGGQDPPPSDSDYLNKSQMVLLHHRGVRCISLWPRPESAEVVPHHVGTSSKDYLGLSKVGIDGCSIEQPALWRAHYPHSIEADVNALRHESIDRMWSGGNDGSVRCWDVNASAANGCLGKVMLSSRSWVSGIEVWPQAGVLVAAHSSGITYVDTKAGKVIRTQYTQLPASKLCVPSQGHNTLFVGIGNELMQYDTRSFANSSGEKPKAVGQWTLRDQVMSVACTRTSRGNILVAVGCKDGKVAAFDTM